MLIEQAISNRLETLKPEPIAEAYFDTACALKAVAEASVCAEHALDTLEFLSKRVEISRGLYESYLSTGGRATHRWLDVPYLELALLLLVRDFLRLEQAGQSVVALKRLNAVLKLLAFINAQSSKVSENLVSFINARADQFLNGFSASSTSETPSPLSPVKPLLKELDVTVLFWEGPIARAYLATLKGMGLKPKKIIHLISANDLASAKPIGRFLPGTARLAYAHYRQKSSIHYWSRALQIKESELFNSLKRSIESSLGFSDAIVDEALAVKDLRTYSSSIEKLMINGLKDNALHSYLAALPETTLLFTGGGIVPKALLDMPHLKFVHVHPGYLPDVRGADCALWSELVKGRTSATCFYMAPGIDDGDIIQASYLPVINIDVSRSGKDLKTLYRATYAFVDPWLRARVLREAIIKTVGFTDVKAVSQNESSSMTYHFMHERIQDAVFGRMFKA